MKWIDGESRYVIVIFFFITMQSYLLSGQNAELVPQIGHAGPCSNMQLSKNEKILVSCDNENNTIKFWDFKSGLLIKTANEHNAVINTIDISADGRYMLTAAGNSQTGGELLLWDFESLNVITNLWKNTPGVSGAFFTSDSRMIVFLTEDKTIHLVDVQSKEEIQTLSCGAEMMAVCAERSLFSVFGYRCSTEIFTVDTISKLNTIESPEMAEAGVQCINSASGRFFSSKTSLISGQEDKLFDTKGDFIADIVAPRGSSFVYRAEFSPDGNLLAILYSDARFAGNTRTVCVFEAFTGKALHSLSLKENITSIGFTRDSYRLILGLAGENQTFKGFGLYDLRKKLMIREFGKERAADIAVVTSNESGEEIAVSFIPGRVNYFNSGKLKFDNSVSQFSESDDLLGLYYDHSGKTLAGYSYNKGIYIWDTDTDSLKLNLGGKNMVFLGLDLSRDGQSVAAIVDVNDPRGKGGLKVMIWSLLSGDVIFEVGCDLAFEIHLSPDLRYVATLASGEKEICIWEVGHPVPFCKSEKMGERINGFSFSHDSKEIIFTCGKKFGILDIEKKSTVVKNELFTGKALAAGILSGNRVAIISGFDGSAYQTGNRKIAGVDFITSEVLFEIPNTSVHNVSSWANGSTNVLPCYAGEGKSIEMVDIEQEKVIASIFPVSDSAGNAGFIMVCPDHYYFATRNAYKTVGFRLKNSVFSFDQFDLQFNRPDILLERMGIADTSTISAYRKAYYKRLKKMNFSESMFSPDFHMPVSAILNADEIPDHTENAQLLLKIRATDSKSNLDRFFVWINEVPVFGSDGIDLRSLKMDSVDKEISLNLSRGENRIQVSCLNQYGVESLKESVWINYEPKELVISNRYLCAISVSEYKNPQYNLKYAVKDGRDMATFFAGKNSIVDSLFNQNATRENILALKQKLMQTKVDDEVILYVSGHGLLDRNYDFYFATYDMNFEDPAEKGILYDDLEALLDGIPARKKLLLMDACHSGEVDKDELVVLDQKVALKEGGKGDIKTYGYKGTKLTATDGGSKLGLQNSFELMQELFANLNRGSGAVVISAAAGTGYALESAEWNNGVFTYCILNGLKNLAADANGDKTVTVTELKDYVSTEVELLTNGAQKPTSRRESLEFDWGVW